MGNLSKQKSELNQYKIKTLYEILRNVYIIMFIGGILSTFFSTWSNDTKYQITIFQVIFYSITISLLLLIHKKIQSQKVQLRWYFILIEVTYLIVAFLPYDKYLASITPILPILYLIIFFTFNIAYVIIFGISILFSVLFYFFRDFNPTINLGFGYYFIHIMSTFISVYVFSKAVNMIKWYDNLVENEVNNTLQKNEELIALNEEYYAAQQELHHNYDEILTLNNSAKLMYEKFDAILSVTEDGIIEYNIDKDEYIFSQNAMKHLKIEPYDKINEIVSKINLEDRVNFLDTWWSVIKEEYNEKTIEAGYDDTHFFTFTFIRYQPLNEDAYLLIAVKDITTLKTHEKHIFNLAYKDILTGLYNRLGFIQSVDEYLVNKTHFYLAIMDIDNFKFINNIFGYDVGDVILIEIASKLMATPFEFITRIGDDKFGFIVGDRLELHEQLNQFVTNHELKIHDQLTLNVKYSIGIAEYDGTVDASELLKRAEIAMYQVKQSGKNKYNFYNEQFTEKVEKRLLISNSLEKSVENNEIYMVYQPKYDLKNEKIVSFEALVRWESKEYGNIPPNVFIEIAEQSGFIKNLSEFIIRQSCIFAKKINAYNNHYIISINISGKQLLDSSFAETFIEHLAIEQVPPYYIGLEITETAVIEDLNLAVSELKKLHDYGIKIYLDDFGTGYSSLNYLNQLPVDVIKIDKSFIDHIATNTHDLQLVRSIIQLAQSLGLHTVAEGVESEEQVKLLQMYQCDIAQGYYYDRPLTELQVFNRIQELNTMK
ncbi:MAG: bifunctional diguanylate cyclase/phosphodiesterase [Clostridia bacterium]|nr:bifunctional diguanylate cyclase/phosphodiesterase [Clostridia bacterium]